MQYGSGYILNWLKLCFPRWKGANEGPFKSLTSKWNPPGRRWCTEDSRITEHSPSLYLCTSFHSWYVNGIFWFSLLRQVSSWRCSWEERRSKRRRGDAVLQSSSHQPYQCEAVLAPCARHCLPHTLVWTLMSDQCLVSLVTLPYAMTWNTSTRYRLLSL